MDYASLPTEKRNPNTINLDKMTTAEFIRAMNDENKSVPRAIDLCSEDIALAIDEITKRYAKGGRLIYVGAGTSGRMGALDASECPPTFGVSPDSVIGLIAGGKEAFFRAVEGAEDNFEMGESDLRAQNLSPLDSVVGISAAGGAKYVLGAVDYAKRVGALTVAITSHSASALSAACDIAICPDTGAEVLTGSTRLKAGTAQKLILNMISTAIMVKTGKVYENMMINVQPTNVKLRDRAARILSEITDIERSQASEMLDEHGSIRGAIKAFNAEKSCSETENRNCAEKSCSEVKNVEGN